MVGSELAFGDEAGSVFAPANSAVAVTAYNIERASAPSVGGRTVTVTVQAPFRVVHDGTAYGGGQAVAVPAAVANQWARFGWVTIQPQRPKPAKKPARSKTAAAPRKRR